jgi:hypothetical protein
MSIYKGTSLRRVVVVLAINANWLFLSYFTSYIWKLFVVYVIVSLASALFVHKVIPKYSDTFSKWNLFLYSVAPIIVYFIVKKEDTNIYSYIYSNLSYWVHQLVKSIF